MMKRTTEENDDLARRAAALRIAHPLMTLVAIADELGIAERGRSNVRVSNTVGQLLYRARTKLGIVFPMKPSQPKQVRGAPDRRDRIAVIGRELGLSGVARWVGVDEERARILLGGALPSDDEQMAIDKAFAIARVRLLECVASDFARFSALARLRERAAFRRIVGEEVRDEPW